MASKIKNQMNLSKVDSPSFLLNIPTSFSTKVKNNVWMQPGDEEPDLEIALSQWLDLYNVLSHNGFCTIMPTPYGCTLQDLVYVANLGVVINDDTVVISNFTSEPRKGEAEVGMNYFKLAGYRTVVQNPFKLEGEADLKYIRPNLFIGGYGMRSELKAFEWMEKQFPGLKIIKIKMHAEKNYHLDTLIFPLTSNAIMVCEELLTAKELKEIRAHDITCVNVPLDFAEMGITNNVRVHSFILNASDINDLDPVNDKEYYEAERDKNQFLEDILVEYGMEAIFINLSQYILSGAMLSCMVMHLNRFSYQIDLT